MLKSPNFDDEVDDQEGFQEWMGVQDFAKQQAAAPAAAQQPQVPAIDARTTANTTMAPPGGTGPAPNAPPPPPPPPPPIPGIDDLNPPASMPTPVAPNLNDYVTPIEGGAPQLPTPKVAPTVSDPAAPSGDVAMRTPQVAPGGADPGRELGDVGPRKPKVLPDTSDDDGFVEWMGDRPVSKSGPGAAADGGRQIEGGAKGRKSRAAQAAESWNTELADWVEQIMQSPSRYSSQLVQDGQAVIDASIARDRQEASQRLAEHMAERGLVAGSTEYDTQLMELESRFAEQAAMLKFELGREQAMTWANDLGLAGQLAGMAGGLLNDREAMLLMDERNRMSLRLQAQGMDQAAADRAADREMQKDIADANRDWDREKWREYTEFEYGGDEDPAAPGGTPGGGGVESMPGFNRLFGYGWHDGTPEGEAAWIAAGRP
jgi:hypothetical protein